MEAEFKTSRIGRAPVVLPDGVKAEISGSLLSASGKLGKLSLNLHPKVGAQVSSGSIVLTVTEDDRHVRALHGLMRALVQNMVTGVSTGYEIKLNLVGVGYRASLVGAKLKLEIGKSHEVLMDMPSGISAEISKKQDEIVLKGIDKAVLGQFAADVIRQRPVEPYKGKGIRYAGQVVKLKAGKKAGKK